MSLYWILQNITLEMIAGKAEDCLVTFHMFRLHYLCYHFISSVWLSTSYLYNFYSDLPKTNK
jgi:hypothetical protein